jgi:hypothetical protein
MLQYLVLNDAGDEIKPGDKVFDFRGDRAVFHRVYRGTEYNGVALVEVQFDAEGEPEHVGCYYATVYGLQVQTKCGVPDCDSVNHTTRDHNAEMRK